MADTPLVRQDNTPTTPGPRNSRLTIGIVAIALALLAAAAGWWFLANRQSIPDWERLPELDLAAPAGDAFRGETPWVRLRLTAARPGAETIVRVSLDATRGTLAPNAGAMPSIETVTVQPLGGGLAPPESLALQPEPGSDGVLMGSPRLDGAGWWRFSVEVAGAERLAEFTFLLPDPNVNGPNVVPSTGSSPEGEALFQRGTDTIAALRSVRFTQWLADGKGNAAVSDHAVTAGGDGDPAGFTYRAAGGMEAVIIGSTRWILPPGAADWTKQEGATVVPPAEWGEEFLGSTGFTLLGEETIDGERCQLVAFVVPELSEPRRRTVAWYVWWVGAETGQVRKETMVSRLHYMRNDFGDFDAPLALTPPEDAAGPTEAAPAVAGTPAA